MLLYWTKDHKYYKLFEQKTLFGTTDVVCVWGRKGGNLGNCKVIPCSDQEEVQKTIERIKSKRLKRGYTISDKLTQPILSLKNGPEVRRDTLIMYLKNSEEQIALSDLLYWLSKYTSTDIIYS